MKEADRERINAEFSRIKGTVARAPAPEGDEFPEWTRDGAESTSEFFDATAHLWADRFGPVYQFLHTATADQIPRTDEPITILDVGCGTGLELEFVFERAPNARITGLDQAPRMLAELADTYADRMDQITLVEASCVDWPEGLSDFDFAMSILTVHHFPPDTKRGIYASIRSTLKPTGAYIEGDQMVTAEIERENMALYNAWIAKLPGGDQSAWNYDIRLTAATNCRLLIEAGFASAEKVWDDGDDGRDGHGIIIAR